PVSASGVRGSAHGGRQDDRVGVSGAERPYWYGTERVSGSEKRRRVRSLFTQVAGRYDLMNDLMSLGMHRLWKRFLIDVARLDPSHQVLEIAAGSSDLARMILAGRQPAPRIIVTDINREMLESGRARLMDAGCLAPCLQMDGERLALADACIDRIFLSFGLRNMADQESCLSEMRRVIRPDGMVLIMEFSMDMPATLTPLYNAYTLSWLPRLGRAVADNEDGYRYLAESIRKQRRSQEMSKLLNEAGFTKVKINKLALGAVCVYRASP
ncbi:MAG: ubiquinone/menaquinone biosynthesis methyltransferase, partial [Proteobacteria bacterium]|nr:ubiquinone/menaquinone biosynthesis methyltransferase [Pseudomonadota bacterium]